MSPRWEHGPRAVNQPVGPDAHVSRAILGFFVWSSKGRAWAPEMIRRTTFNRDGARAAAR